MRILEVPLAFVGVVDGDAWFPTMGQAHGFPDLDELQLTVAEAFAQQLAEAGTMIVVADVTADARTRGNSWLRAMGIRAVAGFPMQGTDGCVLGIFCICDTLVRAWTSEHLEVLSALADTAATKAALHLIARRAGVVAELLQHSMLTDLPDVPPLQLACRYLPAQDTEQVGGDWYDAFVLPDATTALVIGDVAGHDLPAAAKMGQLRNLLRGIAMYNNPAPPEVLSGLDTVMHQLKVSELATVVYARVEGPEQGPWRLRWANAGHPPPLLCTADGSARYLDDPSGILLAFGDGQHREGVVDLPSLSTVLLYTDGLVESRTLDVDLGLDRLCQRAEVAAGWPLDQFCEHVVAGLAPDANEDDVTVLALRIPEVADSGAFRWSRELTIST